MENIDEEAKFVTEKTQFELHHKVSTTEDFVSNEKDKMADDHDIPKSPLKELQDGLQISSDYLPESSKVKISDDLTQLPQKREWEDEEPQNVPGENNKEMKELEDTPFYEKTDGNIKFITSTPKKSSRVQEGFKSEISKIFFEHIEDETDENCFVEQPSSYSSFINTSLTCEKDNVTTATMENLQDCDIQVENYETGKSDVAVQTNFKSSASDHCSCCITNSAEKENSTDAVSSEFPPFKKGKLSDDENDDVFKSVLNDQIVPKKEQFDELKENIAPQVITNNDKMVVTSHSKMTFRSRRVGLSRKSKLQPLHRTVEY